MPVGKEMRRLEAKWKGGDSWPQRLEWIEIDRIRGWTNQRVDLRFPITAIVGENGVGKSTLLQAIASAYADPDGKVSRYSSDYFPDTAWDRIGNATRSEEHTSE